MNLLPVLLKKYWLQLSVTLLIAVLAWTTDHYRDNAIQYKSQRDTASHGRRRLLVNATCPAVSTGKSTSAARVDNAARPRLADSAQRDYFTLKERVTTMQKQLEGAQDYIRTQCLK